MLRLGLSVATMVFLNAVITEWWHRKRGRAGAPRWGSSWSCCWSTRCSSRSCPRSCWLPGLPEEDSFLLVVMLSLMATMYDRGPRHPAAGGPAGAPVPRGAWRSGRPGGRPGGRRRMPAEVTWIGHAATLVEIDGVRVLADPLLTRRIGHLRRRGPLPDADVRRYRPRRHLPRPRRPPAPPLAEAGRRDVAARARRGAAGCRAVRRRAGPRARAVGVSGRPARGRREWSSRSPRRRTRVAGGGGTWAAARPSATSSSAPTAVATSRATRTCSTGMSGLGRIDLAAIPIAGWWKKLGPGHLDAETRRRGGGAGRPRAVVPVHWGTYAPEELGLHSRLAVRPRRPLRGRAGGARARRPADQAGTGADAPRGDGPRRRPSSRGPVTGGRWRARRPLRGGAASPDLARRVRPGRRRGRGRRLGCPSQRGEDRHDRRDLLRRGVLGEDAEGWWLRLRLRVAHGSPRSLAGCGSPVGRRADANRLPPLRSSDDLPPARLFPLLGDPPGPLTAGCSRASWAAASRAWCAAAAATGRSRGGSRGGRSPRRRSPARRRCRGWRACPRSTP